MSIKRYSRHWCNRRHRTHRTAAKCIWPNAVWIKGDGPYALLAHCKRLTVTLHESFEDALAAKARVDHHGCGGRCVGEHELIHVDVLMGRQ